MAPRRLHHFHRLRQQRRVYHRCALRARPGRAPGCLCRRRRRTRLPRMGQPRDVAQSAPLSYSHHPRSDLRALAAHADHGAGLSESADERERTCRAHCRRPARDQQTRSRPGIRRRVQKAKCL
eukprot:Amastigsp_a175214_40.p6 type:complete len:123 gc:universal Amastigsp_a175214_40:811-1179(+)